MKRDLDLIRAILADLEGRTKDAPVFARDIKIPGRSAEEVAYHCVLLSDQGFVIGRDASTYSDRNFMVSRMTAQGHDYLDAVKNETIWAKVKTRLAERGVEAPLDVVQRLAQQYIETGLFGSD